MTNEPPNVIQAGRPAITPTEWEHMVTQHIQNMRSEWNEMSVDDRFRVIFNWLKEY